MRTVHRLQQIAFDIARRHHVRQVRARTPVVGKLAQEIALHDRHELAVGVVGEVPAGLIELQLGDVRAEHLLVSLLAQLLGDEVLKLLAHDRAVGGPQHEPLPDRLVDVEQSELLAEQPVIALLRLLQLVEIVGQLFFVGEGGPVHPGQPIRVRVAVPVT